jgi:DNA-binding transcriptional LysR family regulator
VRQADSSAERGFDLLDRRHLAHKCEGAPVLHLAVDSPTAQKRLIETGFGIALLTESNVAEELRSRDIATIKVGDLTASHDVVTVTRRGGLLSAASRRLLEIMLADYRSAYSSGH